MRSLSTIVLLLGVVACSSDPPKLRDLPGDIIDARCKNEVACKTSPDAVTCQSSYTESSNDILTVYADVDAGVIKYNASKAQACLDLENKQGCTFAGFHSTPDDNPCADILTGTIAQNGACVIDEECAGHASCNQTDTNCDRSTACCPGTCGAPVTATAVAIGGACGNGATCVNTAYCKTSGTGGTGTCTALIQGEGTACDALDACAGGMYCNIDFANTGRQATCKKPAATNAACVTTDDLPCGDDRQYCDATTNKCVPRADVGAACPTGVSCVGYASCINATCVEKGKAGAACGGTNQASCLGDLTCTNGTCQLPPAGMSCK